MIPSGAPIMSSTALIIGFTKSDLSPNNNCTMSQRILSRKQAK